MIEYIIEENVVEQEKNKKVKGNNFVLPMLFCSTIVFVGFINMSNFKKQYKESIEENTENRQIALANIENKYAKNFEGKNNFITLNGAFSNIIGKKSLNNVVKLENGYLTEMKPEVNTEDLVKSTVKLRDYLNEQNIPFLYIQAPYKMETDDSYLPVGFKSYANQNADNLISGLNQNGIDTLDLREEIKKDGLDHYSLFFKTDHHWDIEGAFWAHEKVLEKLNSILGESQDNNEYLDISNYNIKTYENWFLGSRGKRVGPYFGGVDDISLITPKFDTNISLEIPSKNIKKSGTFEETILFMKNIDTKNYYNVSSYNAYLGTDYSYVKMKNNNSNNNRKLFLIKDSFSNPMVPFLLNYYGEIHLYDLRQQGSSNEDMIGKIEGIKPDIVSCMYNPSSIYDRPFRFIKE